MTKNTKSKPEHRVGELFLEMVGNPSDLIHTFSNTYDVKLRRVYRYYSGENKTLPHEMAIKFLQFFNENRHPDSNAITLQDLYVSAFKNVDNNINLV
jgi:hypothetical protein